MRNLSKIIESKTNDVFLGGTCNGSRWRDKLKPLLEENNITYFDPVVDDWNDEAYQEELKQRESCKYCLYVITPKMTGVYSIAEVIDDSNKRPNKTVFCFLDKDEGKTFDKHQIKSLTNTGKMVVENGGIVVKNFTELIKILKNE